MYIPAIPTDNLYKFLALSGIALVIISLLYPEHAIRGLKTQSINAQTELSVLNAEAKDISSDIADLKNMKSIAVDKLDDLSRKNNELRIRGLRAGGEVRKIEFFATQESKLLAYSRPLFWLGCAMSFFGFLLWYVKVQRPADALVKKQAPEQGT
jgi:hypothetical protein